MRWRVLITKTVPSAVSIVTALYGIVCLIEITAERRLWMMTRKEFLHYVPCCRLVTSSFEPSS